MKILIVEDEKLAIEHLELLLQRYDPTIEIVGKAQSVQAALKWFEQNEVPDLAFFDIQLADGLSFEILEKAMVRCPIIFATAYDEYTLQAFKVNSIDYLLKPYDLEDITTALEKYKNLKSTFRSSSNNFSSAIELAMQMMRKEYKSRFLVKVGTQLNSIPVEAVTCFFHEHKIVWLQSSAKKYAVDYTLDQLEQLVNPKSFFRINRKFIICYDAIAQVTNYTNSRLKLTLQGYKTNEDIVVSRERVNSFKQWLDG